MLVDRRSEFSFSPNLYDAVVMPYDKQKVQRINYHSLHNTGNSGAPNSSSEEDFHGSRLFSQLVSPVKKEEEKIEAELALVLKEKELIQKKLRSKTLEEQLEREKAELEESKKHDVAVGCMVEGKKGDEKEKEKRSQKKNIQDCPQSKLQLEYANKKIKFEDLKFHQFVAREIKIIVSCKNDKEKNGRLTLLKKTSYYYELYDWKALLPFYAAWIRRVESGQNKWSDDTADIETPLLATVVRSRQKKVSKKSASIVKATSVWFCSNFQKKKCSFSGAHDKVIKGVTSNLFETDMVISPLNSVPKKDTLDREDSVNSHISKDLYLGNPIKISYPSVDSLVELIRRKGSGSLCFQRDLKRTYRHIPICPGDWHLVGFSWDNHIFFDRVLSMGLRSAAYICQRVTNAVSFILDAHYDLQIVSYIYDLGGCDVQEKAFDAYAILGEVLDNCGLEESVEKATPPSTSMVFLGILFDIKMMVKKAGLDHYFYISFTCEPLLDCRIPVFVVCIIRYVYIVV
ncbi:unnamed protein product [Mytilus coruscus]|uniref:Reverse transcriptase domain-containing protein n=1 Tax=Mytilus coruscus TaxID=42192 RepID=A0A6J8CQ77_MYTCO|nr:unnamed protein product [Mytilus coruscus]